MKNLLIILSFFLPVFAGATDYYFATAGGDANTGTIGSPKQTMAAADVLLQTPGNRVFLNRGDVFYGELHPAANTSILSYGTGANPIITGFITLSSWTPMGSNLYESYCPSCSATVNEVAFNGIDQPVGRYPDTTATNGGYLPLLNGTSTTSLVDSTLGATNWVGATANIRTYNEEIDGKTITTQSGYILTWSGALPATPAHGYGYFLTNHISTLSTIGEWFWKSSVDSLIMEFVGSTPGSNTVQISSIDTLISIGASNVTIDGIDLKGANKYLVAITANVTYDTLRNGKLSLCGRNGIELGIYKWDKGAITTTAFRDIHNNAMSIIYPGELDSINIADNSFTNIAIIPGMGASGGASYSAIQIFGYKDSVLRNTFYNIGGAGTAIYGGTGNVWRYNFIQHFSTVVSDAGAIYGSVHDGTTNTIIDNIIIDGVGQHYGTNLPANIYCTGIYLDNGAKNWDVERNTVAYCSYNGYFIHYGSFNTLFNNTAFANKTAQLYIQEDNPSTLARGNILKYNKFISIDSPSLIIAWYVNVNNDINQVGTMDSNYYCRPSRETSPYRNNGGGFFFYNLRSWQVVSGQDAHSKHLNTAITRDSQMLLYYNATMSPTVINLPTGFCDATGLLYAGGAYTLQPFTSLVLVQLPTYYYFPL